MRNSLIIPALVFGVACASLPAQDLGLVWTLRGAKLIAQDDKHTYLGTFSSTYASDSLLNPYGTHGSAYADASIWNEYGIFGGAYSRYSPFNAHTSTPPMIIKDGKIIGYLTTNPCLHGALDPNRLKAIADQF